MRVAVVGAGAIGGLLTAHLCRAGADPLLVARGATLEAIRAQGLTVVGPGAEERLTVRPRCTDDLAAVSGAEAVMLTVKAPQVPQLAAPIGRALAPGAVVVTTQNGLPWWYFLHGPVAPLGLRLESVDPGGSVSGAIDPTRVLGCVVYAAAEVSAPGVVAHREGRKFSLGEPDGSRSDRCRALAAVLSRAGLRAPVQVRIREEIWLKLAGNATFNPISALTGATLAEIATSTAGRALAAAAMEEVYAIAASVGVSVPLSIERRIAGAAAVGAHATSMLQDVERGRELEVDAILGSVLEVATHTAVPAPRLTLLRDCVRLLGEVSRRSPPPSS